MSANATSVLRAVRTEMASDVYPAGLCSARAGVARASSAPALLLQGSSRAAALATTVEGDTAATRSAVALLLLLLLELPRLDAKFTPEALLLELGPLPLLL